MDSEMRYGEVVISVRRLSAPVASRTQEKSNGQVSNAMLAIASGKEFSRVTVRVSTTRTVRLGILLI
ncbi:MAG: hypothetical protein ACYDGY_10000 [Acidimicrobiales bacterium]